MVPLLIALTQGPRFSPPTVPDGWGVNIHFTDQQPGELAKVAGPFRWVRMDFAWGGIERRKGEYDFSAYDRLLASLKRVKLRPYFILDYGNDLYGDGSPRNAESRAAFCRWVEAAMARYKGRGIVWEMWNEPNGGFWKPTANVDEYIALAKEVGKTIRRVAPKETYIGPATSGVDFSYIQRCLDAGLLKYWDAISVHPYRQNEPESAEAEWLQLRTMVDRAGGKKIPLISGEWGYSELFQNQTKERQAQFVARQYLLNLSCGVPISIYYDWKDDGVDPKEPEHHFGTVFPDLSPKPAYRAAVRLVKGLEGFSYVTRLRAADAQQWLLLFRRGKEARVAAWTVGPASTAALPGQRVSLDGMPKVVKGASLAPLLSWKPEPWAEVSSTRIQEAAGERSVERRFGNVLLRQITKVSAERPLSLTVRPDRQGDGLGAVIENPRGRDLKGGSISFLSQGGRSVRGIATDGAMPVPAKTTGVTIQVGGQTMTERVPRFVPVALAEATASMDGDAKIRGSVSKHETAEAIRMDYDFDPGWRFAELHPADGKVEGRPSGVGMWLLGDGLGNLLCMRYTDATGQTFQPGGGTINWTGWRYVSYRFDGASAHWGGANDGVVHWPIRIGTLVLVDMPGRRGGQGSITVRRPALAY